LFSTTDTIIKIIKSTINTPENIILRLQPPKNPAIAANIAKTILAIIGKTDNGKRTNEKINPMPSINRITANTFADVTILA
jgi:hypothetical protein